MLEKKEANCTKCHTPCDKNFIFKTEKGLTEKTITEISAQKQEPAWMLEFRLQAFNFFKSKKLPSWGPDLSQLNIEDLYLYLKPNTKQEDSWEKLPENIRNNFDSAGLQDAEKNYLGGLGAQYESEVVYHNLKKELEIQGVIFTDTDTALKKYPEIFRKYFSTVVPYTDNKFAALNSAVWSGGSFIYVPPNVQVDIPLQAYYKIGAEQSGQFERTLIIADEGSCVNYIEGCTAQTHSKSSLHSAVVEIIAKKDSTVRYYTIQNWSKNIYNLVTKRAIAYQNSVVEWIDSNIGSGVTMKYPAVILKEQNAKAEILSLAIAASDQQIQDSGAKIFHMAPNTSARVISKSICSNGGRTTFRGVIKIAKNAHNTKSYMQCDSLITDDKSRADAYPYIEVSEKNVDLGHEAKISKISDEQIFYLQSRGICSQDAQSLIINGFVDSFTKKLPPEYALEISRLIDMEIRGGD